MTKLTKKEKIQLLDDKSKPDFRKRMSINAKRKKFQQEEISYRPQVDYPVNVEDHLFLANNIRH